MEDMIYEKRSRNQPDTDADNLGFLTPEGKILVYRTKGILDCFEEETEFDRTTIFKAVLNKMSSLVGELKTIDPMDMMVYLAESMLGQALNGELEISDEE